eukprot:2909297-Rhodomonas_salina.1
MRCPVPTYRNVLPGAKRRLQTTWGPSRKVLRSTPQSAYARATRCPVLTYGVLLPARRVDSPGQKRTVSEARRDLDRPGTECYVPMHPGLEDNFLDAQLKPEVPFSYLLCYARAMRCLVRYISQYDVYTGVLQHLKSQGLGTHQRGSIWPSDACQQTSSDMCVCVCMLSDSGCGTCS